MRTAPEVGDSRPATMDSSVVLPAPLGPSRPKSLSLVNGEADFLEGHGRTVAMVQGDGFKDRLRH